MSDNLKKKKLDGKRTSRQSWEQRYRKKKAVAKKKAAKKKRPPKKKKVASRKRCNGYIVSVNLLYRIPAGRKINLRKFCTLKDINLN